MILYKFFKNLITHIRYSSILNKVYKEENLISNLSELFESEFKRDWLGRLYTVVNPNIKDGKYDQSNQVFEYGEDGLNNEVYVERIIMQKLNIAEKFITNNNLFELLTYEIRKLDEYDNYLFIVKPITLDSMLISTKNLIYLIIGLASAGIGTIILIK